MLRERDIPVNAVAVTSIIGNPKKILGINVYGMDELGDMDYWKKAMIVVGVTSKFRYEIVTKLKKLGFLNIMELEENQ